MRRAAQTLVLTAVLALAFLSWRDAAIIIGLSKAEISGPPTASADPRVVVAQRVARNPFQVERSEDERGQSLASAKSLLIEAPLEPVAMRELALLSATVDEAVYANRLILAERITRRDNITQMLLFFVAVGQGRDRPALGHIDKLLTVSPEAGAEIYTPLVSLLASSDARQAISAYAYRPWYGSFLAVAAEKAPQTAELLDLLDRAKLTPEQAKRLLPALLKRSLDEGGYAQARYAAIKHGGARAAAIDEFGLNEDTLNSEFAPMTWQTTSSPAAEFVPSGSDSLLVTLTPETRVMLLERVTGLPAAPYMMSQWVGGNESGGNLQLQWTLTCETALPSAAPWKQGVPVPTGRVRYQSRVVVPAACPVQRWRLIGYLGGQQIDGAFEIGGLKLTSASR